MIRKHRPTRLVASLILAVVASTTAGCSFGQGACAAPRAELPATAKPGAAITVRLFELWSSCSDQGQGPSKPMSTVEIRAVTAKEPIRVVAKASADVAQDGSATVALTLPADAAGTISIQVGDQTVGELSVLGG